MNLREFDVPDVKLFVPRRFTDARGSFSEIVHRLDAVRAHLLELAGDHPGAIAHYQTAAARTNPETLPSP